MKANFRTVCSYVLLALTVCSSAGADAEELQFGMSTVLRGPAEALGRDVRAGVEAVFFEANEAGGINGHKLRLIVLDDGCDDFATKPIDRAILISQIAGWLQPQEASTISADV